MEEDGFLVAHDLGDADDLPGGLAGGGAVDLEDAPDGVADEDVGAGGDGEVWGHGWARWWPVGDDAERQRRVAHLRRQGQGGEVGLWGGCDTGCRAWAACEGGGLVEHQPAAVGSSQPQRLSEDPSRPSAGC